MHFKNYDELLKELENKPSEDNLVFEDGIWWLKQSYAIDRMNEIYGEGNWAIEKIRKSELRNERGEFFGNTCIVTLGYKHPVSGEWIKTDGISATDGDLDNNIIGRALLNALGHLGETFGRFLISQFGEGI